MAVDAHPREQVHFGVEGMPCAVRVERNLNTLDGVDAVVNYASEAASIVVCPSAVAVGDLLEAVATAGDNGNEAIGMFVVIDRIKATSALAVAERRELGLTPGLLTGGSDRTARAVADEVGVESAIAGVLSEGKSDSVSRLQEQGGRRDGRGLRQ